MPPDEIDIEKKQILRSTGAAHTGNSKQVDGLPQIGHAGWLQYFVDKLRRSEPFNVWAQLTISQVFGEYEGSNLEEDQEVLGESPENKWVVYRKSRYNKIKEAKVPQLQN